MENYKLMNVPGSFSRIAEAVGTAPARDALRPCMLVPPLSSAVI